MNNYLIMSAAFEARKNTRASLVTAGVAGLILLLSFFWSWTLPAIPPIPVEQGILVELNIPEEELIGTVDGGGGGGNPVESPGERGTASAPPQPGTNEDARDIPEDPTETTSPAILRPDNPNQQSKEINKNNSVVKTEPKPNPQPPAPAKPKAVLGRTTSGSSTGGGVSTTYDRAGGSGTGSGVGNGSGTGGGTGTGSGGGNGPGLGRGTGPSVERGDRRIVKSYAFRGQLERATIFADIKVAPNGVGTFVQFARGSTATSTPYRNAIIQYLRNMKFNTADHESMVTVKFNFLVNG